MQNYFSNIIAKIRRLNLFILQILIVATKSIRAQRRIKYTYINVFLVGLCSIPLTSCKTIFEEDLTDKVVDLIIPTNNDTSYTNNVHFKWNEMEGATAYRLQIVEPSFANINTFILDSAIVAAEFFYPLSPGNYQFQIRGENSAYESEYVGPYSLYVDSVSDLSSQVVPLISPLDLIYSNADNFTFSWQNVYAAETYEFGLRSGAAFVSGTVLYNAINIYGTSYSIPTGFFPTEGAYSWGIKAHNQNSSSGFSDRTIFIDLTLPNNPLAVSPAHGAILADTVVLKWNSGADPGTVNSPISAHVEIGSDTLFTTILQTYDVNVDSVQHIFTSPNDYWWRVYLFDEAGNISDFYSEHRKIIIP